MRRSGSGGGTRRWRTAATAAVLAAVGIGVTGCDGRGTDLVGPSAPGVTAAKPPKGGGGSNAIPATGTFGPGALGGAVFATVAGTIVEAFSTSDRVPVTFDCTLIEALDGAPDFPGCTGQSTATGTIENAGFTAMRELTAGDNPDAGASGVGADGYARQARISWTYGGTTYLLQYGESSQPPHYARVECLTVVDGACVDAVADSKEGVYDSSVAPGTVSSRATGSVARLLSGKGRLRPVGLYRVPFSLTVCGQGGTCQ